MTLGELAKALAGGVIRAERLFLGGVPGNPLGDRAHLFHHAPPVLWVLEQLGDPGIGAVVRLYVGLHQQLAEQDADPNVGERLEGEQPLRCRYELAGLGVLALDLLDDRSDRLVDKWDPDVFRTGHRRKNRSIPTAGRATQCSLPRAA